MVVCVIEEEIYKFNTCINFKFSDCGGLFRYYESLLKYLSLIKSLTVFIEDNDLAIISDFTQLSTAAGECYMSLVSDKNPESLKNLLMLSLTEEEKSVISSISFSDVSFYNFLKLNNNLYKIAPAWTFKTP